MKTFAPFARSAQVFFAAPNVEGFSRIASSARFAGPGFSARENRSPSISFALYINASQVFNRVKVIKKEKGFK